MAQLTGKFLADIFEQEIPLGDVDGVNDEFTLSQKPISNKSVIVFINGIIQAQGAHYTISNQTITFTNPPSLGQVPYVFYLYR
jgi:hypothetical protein